MRRGRRPAAFALVAGLVACGSDQRLGEKGAATESASVAVGAGSGAGGFDFGPGDSGGGPPDPDSPGLCGSLVHHVVQDAPNLYFVFDGSGSMARATPGGTAYNVTRTAAVDLVRALGPLANVGAAIFPSVSGGCASGYQVMDVRPGDPVSKEDGDTVELFRYVTARSPSGGTPTAGTLRKLESTLRALPGETVVLLLTDGGPNCNDELVCGAAECIPNIDGECPTDLGNCCSLAHGDGAPLNCLDEQATVDVLGALAAEGVRTYVIGIPGSEDYEPVLDAMAQAGGAAQPTPPYYYPVSDFDELGAVLGTIADVEVTCTFELDEAPADPGMTNVYFDGKVVPFDPHDGWVWAADDAIELVGTACAFVKDGQVGTVQVAVGCPTETPK